MFLSTLVKPCEFSLWGLRCLLWAFKFLVGFFPRYSGDFLHLQLWIDEKTALGIFFSKCSIQYWVKYRLSLTSKGGGIGCPLDAFKCRIYRSGSRVDITKFNFEHKVFQKYSIQSAAIFSLLLLNVDAAQRLTWTFQIVLKIIVVWILPSQRGFRHWDIQPFLHFWLPSLHHFSFTWKH